MPGKITMSERPRMGRVCGNECADTRAGASGFPAAPRMLINSVSGDVIERFYRYRLDAAARERFGRKF